MLTCSTGAGKQAVHAVETFIEGVGVAVDTAGAVAQTVADGNIIGTYKLASGVILQIPDLTVTHSVRLPCSCPPPAVHACATRPTRRPHVPHVPHASRPQHDPFVATVQSWFRESVAPKLTQVTQVRVRRAPRAASPWR